MVTHTSQRSSTPTLLCPCGKTSSTDLERIPRGVLIKIFLFWLPLKRYKQVSLEMPEEEIGIEETQA